MHVHMYMHMNFCHGVIVRTFCTFVIVCTYVCAYCTLVIVRTYVCTTCTYVRMSLCVQVETVVDDIADAVGKLKNLSNVKLLVCCDELVQGMMAGLRRNDRLTKLAIAGE